MPKIELTEEMVEILDDCEVGSYELEETKGSLEIVESGDYEGSGDKYLYREVIFKMNDKYYSAKFSKSNSGYWSDSEYVEPKKACEVYPETKTITVTNWVAVKD